MKRKDFHELFVHRKLPIHTPLEVNRIPDTHVQRLAFAAASVRRVFPLPHVLNRNFTDSTTKSNCDFNLAGNTERFAVCP